MPMTFPSPREAARAREPLQKRDADSEFPPEGRSSAQIAVQDARTDWHVDHNDHSRPSKQSFSEKDSSQNFWFRISFMLVYSLKFNFVPCNCGSVTPALFLKEILRISD
jgi:hypothetical protein